LTACGNNEVRDLEQYVESVKSAPAEIIEPVPLFETYPAFTYNASSLRSPFETFVLAEKRNDQLNQSVIQPDLKRTKDKLEAFNIDDLVMVGTLQKQQGSLWAIIQEQKTGNLYRVKAGDYLGQNHGKIQSIIAAAIYLVEIVPDGKAAWVERPHTLHLKQP
jgi:type IV pilus assembly protein PilP